MGWLGNFIEQIAGQKPSDWAFVDSLSAPNDAAQVVPDESYIELYVDSIHLGRVRKFATTFDGIVYAFAETAREGTAPTKFSAVTKPTEITNIGQSSLNNVITFDKRLFKVIPWRGDPFQLQLGLFAVKTGNIAGKIADYVVRLSNTVSPGITAAVNPFLPLVTEGLDLIAGQKDDVELELAIDTSLKGAFAKRYAVIRKPSAEIIPSQLTVNQSGKLLYKGAALDASYCVFSVRSRRDNPDWGEIDSLRAAFEELKKAIIAGQTKPAEEAQAFFNRVVSVCPDLIDMDKARLKRKADEMMSSAFSGGKISMDAQFSKGVEAMSLSDLKLYDT